MVYKLGKRRKKLKNYQLSDAAFQNIIDQMANEISMSQSDSFIVSFEGLTSLAYHDGHRQLLSDLKDALSGVDIKILYYVRDPRGYVLSKYVSETRNAANPKFIDWLVRLPQTHLDMSVPYHAYAQVFGARNVIVRNYSDVAEGGLLDDLLGVVGSSYSARSLPVARQNQTLSSKLDCEQIRRQRLSLKGIADDPTMVFGAELEAVWDEFLKKIDAINAANHAFFREQFAQSPHPLTIPFLISKEREVNTFHRTNDAAE